MLLVWHCLSVLLVLDHRLLLLVMNVRHDGLAMLHVWISIVRVEIHLRGDGVLDTVHILIGHVIVLLHHWVLLAVHANTLIV